MLCAFIFGAAELAFVHAIGRSVSAIQLGFLRNLVGGLVLATAAVAAGRRFSIRSANPKAQLMRAFFSATGYWALVYMFANLPFADATAITYLRGIFMAVIGALVLHERVRLIRWLGVCTGAVGAVFAIAPVLGGPVIVYLAAMGAPALNAAMQAASRHAVQSDPVDTTMAWLCGIGIVAFSPALATHWEQPDIRTAVCLAAVAILGPLASYLSLWALRHAEVSALAPWDYARLIVNTLIALVLFGEVPSLWVWCGMAIIIVGCLIQSCPELPLFSRRRQLGV